MKDREHRRDGTPLAERGRVRAWIIDDSEPLREVYREAITDSGLPIQVLAWDEADDRRNFGELPDSVALSGWDVLHRRSACRSYLEGVGRIVILADVPMGLLAGPTLERPGIAALSLPFTLDDFDLAARWLSWLSLEPEWNGADVADVQPEPAPAPPRSEASASYPRETSGRAAAGRTARPRLQQVAAGVTMSGER